jgi:hypothetical protein
MGDHFQSTKALVEGAIQTLGVSPEAARAQEGQGHTSWTLQRGSAAILIALATRETGPGSSALYLRVISPIMSLPEPSKREALYKHVLELNAQGLANAAFGLVSDRIVAVSERPAENLQSEEVVQVVRHLAAVADTYDNRLVKTFGGELASDKKR